MSDGPGKLSRSGPPVLDDLILGEDEATQPSPPRMKPLHENDIAPRPSSSETLKVSVPPDGRPSEPKKRAKMTLRIPDDEVSRPVVAEAEPPHAKSAASRLLAVEDGAPASRSAEAAANIRASGSSRYALGVDGSQERGWTPYQPPVEDRSHLEDTPREGLPPSAPSDDIPVDTDDEDDEKTHPRLSVPIEEEEEVRVDDVNRRTDPGDTTAETEIDPEDLIGVESLPPADRQASQAQSPSGKHVAATPAARLPEPSPPRVQPAAAPLVVIPQVGALAPPPMTESAALRKKIRPWWEDLFNDDYIRTMAKISDKEIAREATFIEESLGCEAGAMLLDLACGTGQHAIELASRGYKVCGFDLSLSMLARASDEAQERGQKINFVQGDMREMSFDETFDGVYSWNTSFGYFDEEKNNAVVAKVRRALKTGGQFLLDVVNRDYIIRQAPSLAWFEGDGCVCMDEMHIDFITSRMKVKRTLMMDDGRTKEIEYSIRIYSLHELGKMLNDNGFRVAEVSGRTGTPGVFFGCESPRTLILAEKR